MYILGINLKNKYLKIAFGNIIASIVCYIFGYVYELYSHGVYSNYMIYAFLIPFILGVVVHIILYIIFTERTTSKISSSMYNCGIATLTVGSIFNGVLEIYGTTNDLIYVYLVLGLVLIFWGIITMIFSLKKSNKKEMTHSI